MPNLTKASASIPYAAAQQFTHLVGSMQPGVCVQYFRGKMVSGGVFTWDALGMKGPYGTDYSVIVIDEGSGSVNAVTGANKAAGQITVSGPAANNNICVLVIGRMYDINNKVG